MFSKQGERRKEADILILDRELGVIVIEVKDIRIEQLQSISGSKWATQGFYQQTISPYEQAEDSAYHFTNWLGSRDRVLRNRVSGRALVALPQISSESWEKSEVTNVPSAPQDEVIFSDQLTPSLLLDRIIDTPTIVRGTELDEDQWRLVLSYMNATHLHRKEAISNVEITPKSKKSEVVRTIHSMIHDVDLQQTQIGLTIPEGVQRIRGIAGSGKTVLLCQKIAHMHLKHPDWKLGFTFFTRSLYDTITQSIDQWLKYYSQGEVSFESAKSRIKVMHAWGAKNQPGLYSEACALMGLPKKTPNDTHARQPNESLAEVIHGLLTTLEENSKTIPQVFDALLIDEGQDLVVDPPELKYQGKQSIYWLAYQLLKPVNEENPDQRRLIWAYDEAQRLDALAIPSAREIFGDERAHLFKGIHKGNVKKSEIMKRCYRTPGPILTCAHAIGMGFLREGGMLSGITSKDEWEKIGYEVEGDFRKKDSEIKIHRPKGNSPNPMPQLWPDELITYERFSSMDAQLDKLAEQLRQDVFEHGLKPSRQLLVVVLADGYEASRAEREVAEGLMKREVPIYIPTAVSKDITRFKYPNTQPNRFWCDGAVTVSRVTRAKGNEAEMVYVVGLERVACDEANHAMRNQLFVALTRARCWLHLSGVSSETQISEDLFYDELTRVLASGDTFQVINKPSVHLIEHEEIDSLFSEDQLNGETSEDI